MKINQPKAHPEGPETADLLIVGDFPSWEDIKHGGVFQDLAGREFSKILSSLGILRTETRMTYACMYVPPGEKRSYLFEKKTKGIAQGFPFIEGRYVHPMLVESFSFLQKEIARCQPKTILALGDEALWALTGESSISKWRSSELHLNPVWSGPYDPTIRVIPSYSPREVLRMWEWKALLVHDVKRSISVPAPEPEWNFSIPVSFHAAKEVLLDLLRRIRLGEIKYLSADIETVERTYIDCIGFGWSRSEAICIPFIRASNLEPLYTAEEEAELILLCCDVMAEAEIVGQNWYYDAQYIAKFWGRRIEPAFDTMIAHAVIWPGTQKSLDYLSSLYLPWHRYWKHELGKAASQADDQIRWDYNCKDCCSTWALREPLEEAILKYDLGKPLAHVHALFNPLMNMMMRGVRQDLDQRTEMMNMITPQQQELETFFDDITAQAFPDVVLAGKTCKTPWYRSPQQQVKLFYGEFQLPEQRNRKTRRPSMDDTALEKLKIKEPLFKPVFDALSDYRSLGVFLSTYILVNLGADKRFHCSYNPVGTETFRFNSSEDVFGVGGNGQNIPVGNE